MGEVPDVLHTHQALFDSVTDEAGYITLDTKLGSVSLGQAVTRLWNGDGHTSRLATKLSGNLDGLVSSNPELLQPGLESFASLVVWRSEIPTASNSTMIGKRDSSGVGWNTGLLASGALLAQCSDGTSGSKTVVIPGSNWDRDWHYCLQVINRTDSKMYAYSDKGSGSVSISGLGTLSNLDRYGLGQKQGVALAPHNGGAMVAYSAYWIGTKAENLTSASGDALWLSQLENRAPLEPGDTANLFNTTISGKYTGVKFVIPSGFHRVRFHDSELTDCEIEFEANARGRFIFEQIDFVGGTIKTLGESVVGVTIRDCQLEEHHGIDIGFKNSDLNLIENNAFIRMKGIGVRCATSGVTISGNNFENKSDVQSRTFPHISIEPDIPGNYSGGLCTIKGNRFGGESGASAGPPKYCIRLGPEVPVIGTMTNIRITGNDFYGRLGGALTDSAASPILMTKEIMDSNVTGNFVRSTYIGEVIENIALGQGIGPRNNVFDNSIEPSGPAYAKSMTDTRGWNVR